MHVDWQIRYVGRAARYDRDPTQADLSEYQDYAYAGAKFYHNVTLRYDLAGALKGGQVFVGCNNLFGDKPPLGLVEGAIGDQSYDLGRYIYGGVRFRR